MSKNRYSSETERAKSEKTNIMLGHTKAFEQGAPQETNTSYSKLLYWNNESIGGQFSTSKAKDCSI